MVNPAWGGFLFLLLLSLFQALFIRCEYNITWLILLTKPWCCRGQPTLELEHLEAGSGTRAWRGKCLDTNAMEVLVHRKYSVTHPSRSPSEAILLLPGLVVSDSGLKMRNVVLQVTAWESFTVKQCFRCSQGRTLPREWSLEPAVCFGYHYTLERGEA